MNSLKHFLIIATIVLTGCATYNQTTQGFQTLFYSGNFIEADKKLTSNPKAETGINKLLYYFNRGTTLFMLGESAESNLYFEKADKFFSAFMEKQGVEYYNYNYQKIQEFDQSLNGFSDYEGHMYEDQSDIFSDELGKIVKDM